LWAYFVSSEPIPLSEAAQKRNAIRYRNTAFIFFALDFIASILIAYQFAVRSFLEKQELFLTAPEYEKGSNVILNIAKRILYGGEVLLHRYAKLFADWFGNTKATAVLSVLIPLAIVFAVLGAVWTNEWLKNLPEKSTEEEPEDDGQRA
jgi:hypothetical protein